MQHNNEHQTIMRNMLLMLAVMIGIAAAFVYWLVQITVQMKMG